MHMNSIVYCSRRKFLRSAVGLTVLTGTTQLLQAAKSSVIVGAHPWVYAATQPKHDITPVLPQIFADMSYAGMDGIELMSSALQPDDAVESIGQLSQQHKLPIIGASFSGAMWNREKHREILDDAAKVIPRLSKLGGHTLGTSVGAVKWGSKTPKTPEQLDAQAEILRKIIALCEKHAIELNLHNHTYEVENDLHDLKGSLARIPDVKLGPDLNWLVRGGVDPVSFIRHYGKQIVFLHLRDQKADGTWPEAMGEGAMDHAAIGQALHDVGFSGPAVIELAHERNFNPTRPLRESLKMSREFVRKVMKY